MKIVYFASLRRALGREEDIVDPPAEIATIAQLQIWLATLSPQHESAFGQSPKWLAAIDQSYAAPDSQIAGASEIAFFPPVTGG